MGVSTDGQICYGILFEEYYEFPWSVEDDDDLDIDDWWLDETGYNEQYPYLPNGDYAPGFSKDNPRINAYWESRNAWLQSHPMPFTLVNYQSGEVPAYILAIPSTVITAHRGYPKEIELNLFTNVVESDREAFIAFCKRYNLMISDLKWFLSSYWG